MGRPIRGRRDRRGHDRCHVLRGLHGLAAAVCLGLGSGLMTFGQASADPEALQPTVVAVVDVQHLLQNSTAAEGIQQRIEERRQQYAQEMAQQERELRRLEQDLVRARSVLPAEEFAEKRRTFERRVAETQRRFQARKRLLDQTFTDSMRTVRDEILETVSAVAGEVGANVVLLKQQVVVVDKSLDITEDVLIRLNQQLPVVEVEIPDDRIGP